MTGTLLRVTFLVTFAALVLGQNLRENPQDYNENSIQLKKDSSYILIAPKIVRPGHIYRVVITLLNLDYSVIYVRSSVSRNGVQIASADTKITQPGISVVLMMRIPNNSPSGIYKLRVDGGLSDNRGSIFMKEAELKFSPRSLTIVIQTNKATYNYHDIVKARLIMLTTEQKPFQDPVDIYIVEPQGYIARRWMSHQSSLGVVSIRFKIPHNPTTGWWIIRVVAQGQVVEEKIWVKRALGPNLFVRVDAPAFVLDSEDYITGIVHTNKDRTLAPIYGSLVLYALVKMPRTVSRNAVMKETNKRIIKRYYGVHKFKFPMSELRDLAYPLLNAKIEIRAKATEYFTNNTFTGYVRVKVINETLAFRFLGSNTQMFKPGMPFVTYVAISYSDQVSLGADLLASSVLNIIPEVVKSSGSSNGYDMEPIRATFPASGVFKIKIRTPKNAAKIHFKAIYRDRKYDEEAHLEAIASYAPDNKNVHISTSTSNGMVGEFIIFHFRSNFYVDKFYYVVMAKGIIQTAATQSVTGNNQITHSFAIPVSPEMSPSTTLVVYVISDNNILSDSVTIPVNGIARNQLYVDLNTGKDKTGKSVEMNIVNYPGAMTFISAMDVESYDRQSKNEINQYKILNEMYKFEENRNRLQRIVWRSREGMQSTRNYYVTSNYGFDAFETFETVGLIVHSDANFTMRPDPCEHYGRNIDEETTTTAFPFNINRQTDLKKNHKKYLKCATGTICYPAVYRCDGRSYCLDKSDEDGCDNNEDYFDEMSANYHMNRKNMQGLAYNPTGKDFAWEDISIGPNEDTQIYVKFPRRPTQWRFNAFSMHADLGFGMIEQPIVHDGRLPFYMTVEAPYSAVIYEQIGIRIAVFNNMRYEIEVLLELKKSKKFKFVMVDGLGAVSHYNPRTTQSNIQHLIFVKANSHKIVHVPVVPITEGKIKVSIDGRTQVGTDRVTSSIKIVSEGANQFHHTSLLLNLRNIPVQLSYLNINITETPVIPYELYRRYVWGSPKGQISVSGDVVGPAFPKFPVKPSDLRLTNIKSGELKAFNFAYHLFTLRYLWITNQWDSKLGKKVFNHLQVSYSDMIGLHKKNYFFVSKASRPSVWLTAQIARILQLARYPEWENFLYIDPKIIADSISFIISKQKDDGSFYDVQSYPFDRKMSPTVTKQRKFDYLGYPTGETEEVHENITLTAHVLITLVQVTELNGELRIKSSSAKTRALNYLERKLPTITDPYTLAIVTYVLTLANNVVGEKAFYMLDKIKREQEGMVYWSKEKVEFDRPFLQNQRPYIIPRRKKKHDSRNVEATAYALLTYIRREGFVQDKIVDWLVKVKYSDYGFCSTRDTLVAMEALIDYSYRSRVREVTDLQVKIEPSSLPDITKIFSINQDNLSKQQKIVMPDVFGNVESVASGGGLAILQLDVSFGVDRRRVMIPPPVKAYDLKIENTFFGRNNSHFYVNACVKWNLLEESERSGFTMLEIQLPSGYYKWQNHMVSHRKKFPNVTNGIIRDRAAKIVFDSVGNEFTCLNFTVNRWYPVANLTRFMLARVYEYYAPEHFAEEIIDVYAAHVLSICQVCGSYQCPYCPDFSKATINTTSSILLIIFSIIITTYSWRKN